ncbi:hypothetical protein PBI_DEWDROP_72 [Microbacterium phage Dewdrop]|nr:hypothetical protein PBI_LEAF_72 [Microbacterium phage Leaf]QGZ17440.1 hypothetical protein PBI_DEWDROP_72 [Microbacterium phage Dewdrop]
MNINEVVQEQLAERPPEWFAEKRRRAPLPKLRKMVNYAEELLEMIQLGNRSAWVTGRYENLIRSITLNIPD